MVQARSFVSQSDRAFAARLRAHCAMLEAHLNNHGLLILGHLATTAADTLPADHTIVLIGPDEPRFWEVFSTSPEMSDGQSNPMDRWSTRVLQGIADSSAGQALFPFGKPPFLPFFTWALRSGRFWTSPIGFLVHDTCGLFVSFRGALLLPGRPDRPAPNLASPCDTCTGTPCATACPVGAFASGYDVAACKDHVRSVSGTDCKTRGCLARRACPVGQHRRTHAQSAFHMEAFL